MILIALVCGIALPLSIIFNNNIRVVAIGIATALIYFNNPVGIGEHPQFLTELDKIITKISNAEENLKTITKHFDK